MKHSPELELDNKTRSAGKVSPSLIKTISPIFNS
jgi:hypothetical protein